MVVQVQKNIIKNKIHVNYFIHKKKKKIQTRKLWKPSSIRTYEM